MKRNNKAPQAPAELSLFASSNSNTPAHKKKSRFFELEKLRPEESAGSMSHTVAKVKKQPPAELLGQEDEEKYPEKYLHLWYLKKIEDAAGHVGEEQHKLARREVVAQEFFRLLIPGQPKTRLVLDDNGDPFVASKKVAGKRDLPKNTDRGSGQKFFNARLWNRTYRGLGELTTIALLLNEVDLKNGNVFINEMNQLVKIDGDRCFMRLRDNSPDYQITEVELAALPFPGNFSAYKPNNWLGVVIKGSLCPDPFLDPGLSLLPHIRAEINHALLKALILPEALVKNFVAAYIGDEAEAEELANEFLARRQQLRQAALRDPSFLDYLKTPRAQQQFAIYLSYLGQFKTTAKNFIAQKVPELEELAYHELNALLRLAFPDAPEKEKSQPDAGPSGHKLQP